MIFFTVYLGKTRNPTGRTTRLRHRINLGTRRTDRVQVNSNRIVPRTHRRSTNTRRIRARLRNGPQSVLPGTVTETPLVRLLISSPMMHRPISQATPGIDLDSGKLILLSNYYNNSCMNFVLKIYLRFIHRPSYTHHTESYVSEPPGWHDRNDFPSHSNKFGNNNNNNRPSNDAGYQDRPHFSQYQYPSSNEHPSNHPATGDGQWVLLSTNRGYSKSRQRSIKLDALVSANSANVAKSKKQATLGNTGEEEEHVPAVTSKRQVRMGCRKFELEGLLNCWWGFF